MTGEIIEDLRKRILVEEVKDFTIDGSKSICELIEYYGYSHGFMASHLYTASKILAEMKRDKDVLKILSFTGNLVSTGIRGVLSQLIKEGFADVVITTCGTIDHDIARSTGSKYYKGDWNYDDVFLRSVEIHRLGNILIPWENYGVAIEKFTRSLLDELVKQKKEWSGIELLWEVGKRLNDEHSILRAAYQRKVPVIVPGILDGAFGTNLVFHSYLSGFKLDLLSDEKTLSDLVFASKKIGGLLIGGGISKHHALWWSQFKEGMDYSIYITTAVEYDGSLSGAHLREAITWGKLKPSAKHVVVYGDATIILPLVVAGASCFLKSG
ncbi:deoxyhypusine synthase [Thermogladius sp. 4427co]|uniref:deoxyhypusine synthase n=1 Tax=Thermogladius sp. 4427co TaxID=3450718 RepID=UPI003F7A42B7